MKKILTIQVRIDDNGKPKKPELEEINNTLETMQMLVGGTIEVINIGELVLVMNKQGKDIGLPLNCILINEKREVVDGLVGNLICCRVDLDGQFVSIRESDLDIVKKYLIQVHKKEVLLWD